LGVAIHFRAAEERLSLSAAVETVVREAESCGCFTDLKSRPAYEQCPIGRWT